jgi:hypothetical protein
MALFRGIPLLNTWLGYNNRIDGFKTRGGYTEELHTCSQKPDVFVQAVRARAAG